MDNHKLLQSLKTCFATEILNTKLSLQEVTLEIAIDKLLVLCLSLRDEDIFSFDTLIDVCVVDYKDYGVSEWLTERSTLTGFERGVEKRNQDHDAVITKPRFAVIHHLLSTKHNHRLRLRTYAEGEPPTVASVNSIWPAANWFEREAFDMFGVYFTGHPDLRRILTDYGFVGHPFRKDFPLIGNVEVRYDAKEGRVIYQPVTIPARTLVPKTIRKAEDETLFLAPEKTE